MKVTRKLFINKRNGQLSLTLPKKVVDKLVLENNLKTYPRKLDLEILNPKKIKSSLKKHGNNS